MTKIEVPDWVARKVLAGYLRDWDDCSESNKRDLAKIMAKSLTAALGAWVVPIHQIATPEPDWRDINAQHFRMIKGSTAKTRTLYTLRQEKPE